VKTDVLRDESAPPEVVAAAVETVAQTFPTDGLWMDARGNLYLTDVTHDAVTRLAPDGTLERVVEDRKLQWPDTMSEGPDGTLYVSASHINNSPPFNQGQSTRNEPYRVFKFMP
jgi:sugar lactone lactonase YvrE